MWDRFTSGTDVLQCHSSNELIEDIYRTHQEYITGLISPVTTPGSRVPTLCPFMTSPNEGKEALDWGSDEEKYIFPSSQCTPYTENHQILAPLLKNIKGGSCNTMVDGSEVTQLYNMSIDALEVLKCGHDVIFSQCAKCWMKMSSIWLVNENDFIDYMSFSESERLPVRTAAHQIFVEGSGTVLLPHYINESLVTTRIHLVLYIPSMSTCLLSMGEFLQQGRHITGNSLQISLSHKNPLFVQCKPLIPGQTLYWSDAKTTAFFSFDSIFVHLKVQNLMQHVTDVKAFYFSPSYV